MKRPEICIPITDVTRDGIIGRARTFAGLNADMVEWRLDFFAGYEKEVVSVAEELRRILEGKKLIATLRTVREGGEDNGSRFDYRALLTELAASGAPHFVDVEIRRGRETMEAVQSAAQKAGTKVIGSYHDFENTPSCEQIVSILTEARELGAHMGLALIHISEPTRLL